jgi:uncharacterized SAM-binding protein YcdF (DUF218 family)
MTERDAFLAMLFTGPLLQGDAVVVLCGQDGAARLATGVQLFMQQAAPVLLLSGGLEIPPEILGAEHLKADAIGLGVHPDRLILETLSQNTWEQAVQVTGAAIDKGWKRILLVASGYHLPRATLSFIKALEVGRESLQVVPVPTNKTPWTQTVPGTDRTRAEFWPVEYVKTEEYQCTGHCGSYAEGLAYLQHWETH